MRGAEDTADAAGLSLRELRAVAAAEQPHNLTALLPQLEHLVSLIRGKAAPDGAQDRGWDIGEQDEQHVGRGKLCTRCVKVLQRERFRAYEQATEQSAMRYVRWNERNLNPKP